MRLLWRCSDTSQRRHRGVTAVEREAVRLAPWLLSARRVEGHVPEGHRLHLGPDLDEKSDLHAVRECAEKSLRQNTW